ncbi:hypothetical protein RFI_25446 [Reticulomyxa filosa]|uniref:Uncharacterized protein n=1 Tax=Reticulomyxa filosa TaxID=46433 RepID=X6MFX7_RETFI|nr:hypothetical protein RFI_25446 [Reticulomyxa filosa]|eukprot:ETO11930.1 hypothetical protein RFI_25446 [Reticulomyxa filosa]
MWWCYLDLILCNKSIDKPINIDSKKYIVICSNHDAFGVVPSLAVGANENGSGVTALLLLLKWFATLNKHWSTPNEKNQYLSRELNPTATQESPLSEEYHLLFLLTAGGYSNFEGTRQWLEQTEGGKIFLKNVAFVICLDALGIGDDLYLHSTHFNEDDKKTKHKHHQSSSKFRKSSNKHHNEDTDKNNDDDDNNHEKKKKDDDGDHGHDDDNDNDDELDVSDACEDDDPDCQSLKQSQKDKTAAAAAAGDEKADHIRGSFLFIYFYRYNNNNNNNNNKFTHSPN